MPAITQGEHKMKPIHIKWVLAHEPIDIFIRAAEKFAEVAEARAPGQFEIEVLTLSEYADKYNHGEKITKHNLLDLMDSGAIEMSQMYTYVLSKYNNDLDALDLPFLFRDHAHAASVFEGAIGENLLDGYTKNSNIKGMAFTYSGGYMNMPMNREFTSLSEMAGVKVRVSNSPVASATWAALGAEPVVMDVERVAEGIKDGTIDGGESSWPRIYACQQNEVAESILEANHRLLLTNIIVNKNFLAGLPAELQQVMKDAALEAGRFERAVAVAEVEPTKARCEQDGIPVVGLSAEDEQLFRAKSQQVYDQFANAFTPGLVDSIRTLQ
jgi:TRAP-type C4-dicarboxylate transport system substrate-binding protein